MILLLSVYYRWTLQFGLGYYGILVYSVKLVQLFADTSLDWDILGYWFILSNIVLLLRFGAIIGEMYCFQSQKRL